MKESDKIRQELATYKLNHAGKEDKKWYQDMVADYVLRINQAVALENLDKEDHDGDSYQHFFINED